MRHDFSHFTGDRKFIRDDDGQKAFSKLRSSIASSIYQWRSRAQNSRSATERPRVLKEAEFALKQAFAYCPFSPEAVFHYMDLLVMQSSPPRLDDAILVLETCHKLDPYNGSISEWIGQLKRGKSAPAPAEQIKQAFAQIQMAISQGRTNEAAHMLDELFNYAGADPNTLMGVAQSFARMGDLANSEKAMTRLTQIMPDAAESWCNLGTVQAFRGKNSEALVSLKKALDINTARMSKDPKADNLRERLFQDPALASLRQTPEFQAAFGAKP